MQAQLSLLELERWTVTDWVIWNARNKLYFEQVQAHPRVILEGASGLLERLPTDDGSTGLMGLVGQWLNFYGPFLLSCFLSLGTLFVELLFPLAEFT